MQFPTLLALTAGAMLPIQAAINARLGRFLGSPVWAAAVSGAVLTAALVVLGLVMTRGMPRAEGGTALPWWAWTGGLCGAVVLTATTTVAPRLGTATMIAIVIAGQVVCSLLLDHFGLLGLTTYALTPRRLTAAALLIAGAMMIR